MLLMLRRRRGRCLSGVSGGGLLLCMLLLSVLVLSVAVHLVVVIHLPPP